LIREENLGRKAHRPGANLKQNDLTKDLEIVEQGASALHYFSYFAALWRIFAGYRTFCVTEEASQ